MRLDWRFVLIVLVVLGINVLRDYRETEPVPRRPLPQQEPGKIDYGDVERPLPDASPFDPSIKVGLGRKKDSTGTAFAIDDSGWWLTARHVVDRCGELQLRFPNYHGSRVVRVVHHANADLALVRAGGTPHPLSLAEGRLQVGQNGYHVGYPRGAPGEVWSTLLGRRRMRVSGRYRTNEPIVAWAERRRWPAGLKSLGGLSGGPALDAAGRVVGVLVAESRRRGRVYTAAPASITQLVPAGSGGRTAGKSIPITPADLKPRAERLRRAPSVAKVICLVR